MVSELGIGIATSNFGLALNAFWKRDCHVYSITHVHNKKMNIHGDIWRAHFQNVLSGGSFYAFTSPLHYVSSALITQTLKRSHIAASVLI